MFCRPQIKIFIEGLFSFDQDIAAFKEHLRDFLVQIRVRIHLNWNLKCNVDYIFLKIWYTWQITAIALEGMDHYLKQINWYSDTYGLLKVLNVYLHVGYELIQCNLCITHLHGSLWQEFAGEDNQDLFLEEREQAIKQAQEEKRKIQMSVPGILGPHEIQEDMQD